MNSTTGNFVAFEAVAFRDTGSGIHGCSSEIRARAVVGLPSFDFKRVGSVAEAGEQEDAEEEKGLS